LHQPVTLELVRLWLGTNVRRLREARGWTQAELAERAGVEPRTIQGLELGVSARLSTIVAVANVLGVPVARLFRRASVPRPRGPGRPRVRARTGRRRK
jgi:transcriptional regulator with XRE-family HTH domain